MSRVSAKPSKKAAKLGRDSIVEAAFAVLAKEGLEGLSLRALGRQLGVQAPALYWHVRNKAELIGLMAATFGATALRAVPQDTSWSAHLTCYGRALRQAMLDHRDAALLCAMARPMEDPSATADRFSAPLVAAGLDKIHALSFLSSVTAYTLGWLINEQSQAMHEHLAHMIDFSGSFDTGLRAMIRGFTAELAESSPGHPN